MPSDNLSFARALTQCTRRKHPKLNPPTLVRSFLYAMALIWTMNLVHLVVIVYSCLQSEGEHARFLRQDILAKVPLKWDGTINAVEKGARPFAIPILMPVYGRPEYLRRVLLALSEVAGIGDTVLIVSQDGDNMEVFRLVHNFKACPVIHLRHKPPYWGLPGYLLRLGWHSDYATAANIFSLLSYAYDTLQADAAIVLESDLEPSKDFYQYFLWAHREVLQNEALSKKVFNINAWNPCCMGPALRDFPCPASGVPGQDDWEFIANGFQVWGWLSSRQVWPLLKSQWTQFDNWDWQVEQGIRAQDGRVSLSPKICRIRNIGMQGINFNVEDETRIQAWLSVFIPSYVPDYRDHRPNISNWTLPPQH
mmetsp:Transcript_61515/g.109653  ORF Transcript_61515/g.109653 Transcript_61515/m.109653 type:complete len:365 (-) Transcript_61515:396-1490(-)